MVKFKSIHNLTCWLAAATENAIGIKNQFLHIETNDIELLTSALNSTNLKISIWDIEQGFIPATRPGKLKEKLNNVSRELTATPDPKSALSFILNSRITKKIQQQLYILQDFEPYLDDYQVIRQLLITRKSLLSQRKKNILLVTRPGTKLPPEVKKFVLTLELNLPDCQEIEKEVNALIKLWTPYQIDIVDPNLKAQLVLGCRGLSIIKIREILNSIYRKQGTVNNKMLYGILKEKQTLLRDEILEFYLPNITLNDIGGLEPLKTWVRERSPCFNNSFQNDNKSIDPRLYGVPYPRGLLLVGTQGTGKSMMAKAIAKEWSLPLYSCNFDQIFGRYLGESEKQLQKMIETIEELSPCVLWIDEIDKIFSRMSNNGDSGTTTRVMGMFITWLAEKKKPIFIIATANECRSLPPELIRKGRFDEMFYLPLPTAKERKKIFKAILKKLFRKQVLQEGPCFNRVRFQNKSNLLLSEDQLTQLVTVSTKFSGAEIAQGINNALIAACNENRFLTYTDLFQNIVMIFPNGKLNYEEITEKEDWALTGRLRIASL